MKIKARVKELSIKERSGNYKYFVGFTACEKETGCNVVLGRGVDRNMSFANFPESIIENIEISKDFFTFISSVAK